MRCMNILPTSIVSLGRTALVSVEWEQWYWSGVCMLGYCVQDWGSRVYAWMVECRTADVAGSWLYLACTYRMICNWVKSGGVWLNEHIEKDRINVYKIMSITLIGQKVLINGWCYVWPALLCMTNVQGFAGVHWLLYAVLVGETKEICSGGGRLHVLVDVCVQVYT